MADTEYQLFSDDSIIDPIDIELSEEEFEFSENTQQVINLMKDISIVDGNIRYPQVSEVWECNNYFNIAFDIFGVCAPEYNKQLALFIEGQKEGHFKRQVIKYDETLQEQILNEATSFFKNKTNIKIAETFTQKNFNIKLKEFLEKSQLTNNSINVVRSIIEVLFNSAVKSDDQPNKVYSFNDVKDIAPKIKTVRNILNDIISISLVKLSDQMQRSAEEISIDVLLNPDKYSDVSLVCFFIFTRIKLLKINMDIKARRERQQQQYSDRNTQRIIFRQSDEDRMEENDENAEKNIKDSNEMENIFHWVVSVKKYLNNENVKKCLEKNEKFYDGLNAEFESLLRRIIFDPITIVDKYPSISHESKYDKHFFPSTIKIYENQQNIMNKLFAGFNGKGCFVLYTSAPGEGKTTSIVGISKIINDMNTIIKNRNKRKKEKEKEKELLLLFACNSKLVRMEVFNLLHTAFGINFVDTKILKAADLIQIKEGLKKQIDNKIKKNENTCDLEARLRDLNSRNYAFERPRNISEKQRVKTGETQSGKVYGTTVLRDDIMKEEHESQIKNIIDNGNYYIFDEQKPDKQKPDEKKPEPVRTIISDALSAYYIIEDLKEKFEIVLFFDEPMIGADNFGSKSLAINSQLMASIPKYTILSSATLPNNIDEIKNKYKNKYSISDAYIHDIKNNNIRIGMTLKKYDHELYHLFYQISTKKELFLLIQLIENNPLFKKMCTLNSLQKLIEIVEDNTDALFLRDKYEFFINDPNNWKPKNISDKVIEFLRDIDNHIKNDIEVKKWFDFDITKMNSHDVLNKNNILNNLNIINGMTLITSTNPINYFDDYYNLVLRKYNLEGQMKIYFDIMAKLMEEENKLREKQRERKNEGGLQSGDRNKLANIDRDKKILYQQMYNDFPNEHRINSQEYWRRIKQERKAQDLNLNPRINFFNPSEHFKLLQDILVGDTDGKYYKLVTLALCGIGVYSNELNEKYTNLLNLLAKKGKLVFIVADDSVIFGVNYSFVRVIIDEDFSNMHSIESLSQVMGRAGRVGLSSSAEIYIPPIVCFRLYKFISRGKDMIFNEEENLNLQINIMTHTGGLNNLKNIIFKENCGVKYDQIMGSKNNHEKIEKIKINEIARKKGLKNIVNLLIGNLAKIEQNIVPANSQFNGWKRELQQNPDEKKRKELELYLLYGTIFIKSLENKRNKLKSFIDNQIKNFYKEEKEIIEYGLQVLEKERRSTEVEKAKIAVINKIFEKYRIDQSINLNNEFNLFDEKVEEEIEYQRGITQRIKQEKEEFEKRKQESMKNKKLEFIANRKEELDDPRQERERQERERLERERLERERLERERLERERLGQGNAQEEKIKEYNILENTPWDTLRPSQQQRLRELRRQLNILPQRQQPGVYQPPQRQEPGVGAYRPPQRQQPVVDQPPQRQEPGVGAYRPPQRQQPIVDQPPQRQEPGVGAYRPPQRQQPIVDQPQQRQEPGVGAYRPPQRRQQGGSMNYKERVIKYLSKLNKL
jgi:hypothetical protein